MATKKSPAKKASKKTAAPTVFLGIDCGTQSTKVMAYDLAAKKVLAVGSAPHALVSKADGSREQKASWWVDAMKKAMAKIPTGVKARVAGIGVSGQQHGFVPVDAQGNVLVPAKLWCDTTTLAECDEIEAFCGGRQKLIEEGGNGILVGYTASKVLWLKKSHPDLYARMESFLLPHDYLNFWLTGERTMEWGDASGTGLLDVRNRTWNRRVMSAIDGQRDWNRTMPRLLQPHELAGRLTPEAAKALGLAAGLPVSSGGGDNMMGAIGTGTNADGSLTLSLGTSGTLYGFSDKPLVDDGGLLAAFCSSTGGWLPLLCTMNCTVATELTRGLLGKDLGALEKLAAQSGPGAKGVLLLPFFNGERSPNLPKGKASFHGLTAANYDQANLLRAAMESAVYGLRLGLESFTRLGYRPLEIKLIGGGAKSALWRQMVADIFELPVVCPVQEEAAAFGAALQAAWAVESEASKSATDFNAILNAHVAFDKKKSAKPNSKTAATYRVAYAEWKRQLEVMAPQYL